MKEPLANEQDSLSSLKELVRLLKANPFKLDSNAEIVRRAVPELEACLSRHEKLVAHTEAALAAWNECEARKRANEHPDRIRWAYNEFLSQAGQAVLSLSAIEGGPTA